MKYLILIYFFTFSFFFSRAQMLFDIGNNRNFAHANIGYAGAFSNSSIGIARKDSIRCLRTKIIGLLDLSFPISDHFFTRHILKKGFQIDIYKHHYFKIPFMFASSSISRKDTNFKYMDFTTEFSINPGVYKKKFIFALDLKYEIIVLRYVKYSQQYKEDHPNSVNHFSRSSQDVFKIGFITGLNLKNWTIYLKTGYEKNPFSVKKYIPGYIVVGCGYHFGKKTFKK